MSEELKYPGKECGLSESEWVLEQLVDEIRANSSLEGMYALGKLLTYCNIETHKMTADWLLCYARTKKNRE